MYLEKVSGLEDEKQKVEDLDEGGWGSEGDDDF